MTASTSASERYHYNRKIDDYLIEFYCLQEQPWLAQAVLDSFGETHDSLREQYPDAIAATVYLWNRWSDRCALNAIAAMRDRD